jgi:flagellar motor switch protein FliM
MTDFDFRKPPPGDLILRLTGWLTEACRRTVAVWARQLPYPATWTLGTVAQSTAGPTLDGLPDNAVGFRVIPKGDPAAAFLFALPRPLLLALLAGLMGEAPPELPPDRDLSSTELSLCELGLRELFLGPLSAGWPLAGGLTVAAEGPAAPGVIWRLPPTAPVLIAPLTFTAGFGEVATPLVFPRAATFDRLTAIPSPPEPPSTAADRKHIESLVLEMGLDLSVVLGTADLTLNEMARLKPGDLLVLRQKVTEPLAAEVAGTAKFRVWPGALGSRAAVQIHAVAD